MLKLVIEDDEGRKTVVPFVREEITIGRQEGNTIRLTERNVSRRHARLVRHNGSVLVEDLGSYNGIRINGEKIQGQVPIHDGDLIQIGDYDLAIQNDAAAAIAPPPPPPPTGEHPVPTTQEVDTAPNPNPTPAASSAPTELEIPAVTQHPPLNGDGRLRSTSIIRREGVEDANPHAVQEIDPALAPRLVVLNTSFAGREFACIRTELKLGRTDENDINVDHRSLSRTHARLSREPNGDWRVADLESANGMTVNGEPYAQCVLRNGDVVELGHVRFRFVVAGDPYRFIPGKEEGGTRPPRRWPLLLVLLVLVGGGAAAYFFAMPLLQPASLGPVTDPVKPPDPVTATGGPGETEAKLRSARDAFAVKKFEKAKDVLEAMKAAGELPKEAEELLAQTDLELGAKQALAAAGRLLAANSFSEAALELEPARSSAAFAAEYQVLAAKLDAARAKADAARRPTPRDHRPVMPDRPIEKAPDAPVAQGANRLAEEGFALLKTKQYDKALVVLKKCVDVDSAFARCHKGLGVTYAKLREPEKGAFHYRKYVQLAPNDDDVAKVRQILDVYEGSKKAPPSN